LRKMPGITTSPEGIKRGLSLNGYIAYTYITLKSQGPTDVNHSVRLFVIPTARRSY